LINYIHFIAIIVLGILFAPLLICSVRCIFFKCSRFSLFDYLSRAKNSGVVILHSVNPSISMILFSVIICIIVSFCFVSFIFKILLLGFDSSYNHFQILLFFIAVFPVSVSIYYNLYCECFVSNQYLYYYSPRTFFKIVKIKRNDIIGTVAWYFSFVLVVHYRDRDKVKSLFVVGDPERYKLQSILECRI